MNPSQKSSTEIRVRSFKKRTVLQLKNIANYYGLTVAEFVKQELMRVISTTPEHIKEYKVEND